ncbi:cyanoexosortase A [Myxacorys almedinensis]|uniref:Cyanoexosortase A n=1 Tax=Myxacorys almedinensis A TaxID=2690445 RepID=A0A8J8CKM0_9CYAN|nr:cyanoexosortase A [Myxacorys almedinensis]NDJ18756.1 cyanoexosortase A [Myxacorys almedinensis A]
MPERQQGRPSDTKGYKNCPEKPKTFREVEWYQRFPSALFKPSMISSRHTKMLLLGTATALTILQLRLVWNIGQVKGLEPYVLCYTTVWFMMWRKRDALRPVTINSLQLKGKLQHKIFANIIGFAFIFWVVYRSNLTVSYDSALRLFPVVSGLGLVLIAFGFSQLKSYWRELLVLGFLMLPATTITELFDISYATATLSGNLLWYSGFPVIQEGTKLMLPTGFVDVYSGCSGIQSIWQLLTLSFLFTMLFPMGWVQASLLPIAAIAVAFFVNGIRVALMAVLFAQANESAFDYWHLGDGSQIFSMVAVLLFSGVCYGFLEQLEPPVADAQPTEQDS